MAELGANEIDRLRKQLQARRVTLQDEVSAIDDESKDTPSSVPHSQVELRALPGAV